MGCQIGIWLELEQAQLAMPVLRQVERLFGVIESRLTRFAETSELAYLNKRPFQWVPVSNVMWHIVSRALELAKETNGWFDPTILNALEQAGYNQSFEMLGETAYSEPFGRLKTGYAETAVMPQLRANVTYGWRDVTLDHDRQAIRLPKGVRLDLGGIGKGYAAQQAVAFLSQWGPCLIDAGGDLVAGDGPRGWPGWPVGVSMPWTSDAETPEATMRLWLNNSTLATSGIDYRRWQQNGRLQHHLIDPHTSSPAETDALTVSCISHDATRAEAWATAALVAGIETGMEAVEDQALAAVFIEKNQEVSISEEMYRFIM